MSSRLNIVIVIQALFGYVRQRQRVTYDYVYVIR